MYWIACYTDVGRERQVRGEIEAMERGAFLPTFAKIYTMKGKRKSYERPIISRYVLAALHGADDPAWSEINNIEDMKHGVLTNDDKPCRVACEEVSRLMIAHATGACNIIQTRASNGRFGRKRRARPRKGKKARVSAYITCGNSHVTQAV